MKVTSDSIQGQLCFFQVMLHPVLKMHTTPLKESMHSSTAERNLRSKNAALEFGSNANAG